jgi:hypothetical protein
MNGKLFLCEYARVTDNERRFDAIGCGLTCIEIKEFTYPISFAILLQIGMSKSELGKDISFEIVIRDSEGKDAAPTINGVLNISSDHSSTIYSVINFQFLLKREDELTFRFSMDNEEKDCVKLAIKKSDLSIVK